MFITASNKKVPSLCLFWKCLAGLTVTLKKKLLTLRKDVLVRHLILVNKGLLLWIITENVIFKNKSAVVERTLYGLMRLTKVLFNSIVWARDLMDYYKFRLSVVRWPRVSVKTEFNLGIDYCMEVPTGHYEIPLRRSDWYSGRVSLRLRSLCVRIMPKITDSLATRWNYPYWATFSTNAFYSYCV